MTVAARREGMEFYRSGVMEAEVSVYLLASVRLTQQPQNPGFKVSRGTESSYEARNQTTLILSVLCLR